MREREHQRIVYRATDHQFFRVTILTPQGEQMIEPPVFQRGSVTVCFCGGTLHVTQTCAVCGYATPAARELALARMDPEERKIREQLARSLRRPSAGVPPP